jgi:hypothetical protein
MYPGNTSGNTANLFATLAAPRWQETYFAIGELTQEETQGGMRSKALAVTLERMRRECVRGTEGLAA